MLILENVHVGVHSRVPGVLVLFSVCVAYLVVFDDVVDVVDEELLGLDGVDDVGRPLGARVIQVRNLDNTAQHNTALCTVQGGSAWIRVSVGRVSVAKTGARGGGERGAGAAASTVSRKGWLAAGIPSLISATTQCSS